LLFKDISQFYNHKAVDEGPTKVRPTILVDLFL